MRRTLVTALALSLAGSPVLAQSFQTEQAPPARSLRDSIRAEAAKFAAAQPEQSASDEYRPGGMSPGYFWTAIGLMSAGGAYLAVGALLSSECDEFAVDCGGLNTAALVLGSGLLGSGAVVYVLGKKNASAAPQIVTTPRGIAVRSRISF